MELAHKGFQLQVMLQVVINLWVPLPHLFTGLRVTYDEKHASHLHTLFIIAWHDFEFIVRRPNLLGHLINFLLSQIYNDLSTDK
jgi:hypothetical protein